MNKLKQVSCDEFTAFINNYKGNVTPHCWNEITNYFDFNLSSAYPIGSAGKLNDCIIARKVEPFWDSPNEYYIKSNR